MSISQYSILEVNHSASWRMYCVKLNNEYRYYGLIYHTEHDYYIISLMDNNLSVIDHYKTPKTTNNPEQCFLDFCISHDKFFYPELFDTLTDSHQGL